MASRLMCKHAVEHEALRIVVACKIFQVQLAHAATTTSKFEGRDDVMPCATGQQTHV